MNELPGRRFRAVHEADVVVVGAGLAGLTVALSLPEEVRVGLLSRSAPGAGGATPMAQGGMAAALGPHDAPELHAVDTVRAGAGLVDLELAEVLARQAPRAVERLESFGVRFDREPGGGLALGREGAHGQRRILHAGGDATGAELARALGAAAGDKSGMRIFAAARARDLALREGEVVGVVASTPDGAWELHRARAVVLATGGAAGLFLHTTSPLDAVGDGIALAARAGAAIADLEFVQFHPTALAVGADPMPLVTEALRGEGAVLVDGRGRRLLAGAHSAEDLAPRDVVARAIWWAEQAGSRVFLDARRAVGERFPERFPTVFRLCRSFGIDLRREPIPVSPAAHYTIGGIATDPRGRSSLPGLWAVGEVSASGLHGANRLASNSLLEGAVFGVRAAADVAAELATTASFDGRTEAPVELPRFLAASSAVRPGARDAGFPRKLREVLWRHAGVVRSEASLEAAGRRLEEIRRAAAEAAEIDNALLVAELLVAAAAARRESRGAHFREDFTQAEESFARRLLFRLDPTSGLPVRAEPSDDARRAHGVEVA